MDINAVFSITADDGNKEINYYRACQITGPGSVNLTYRHACTIGLISGSGGNFENFV